MRRDCRAVYFGARVLILDEPTAALGVKQSGVVLKYTAAARDAGLGVVFITHNPHHAYLVGNHFIILKLGQTVLDKKRSEVALDELTRLMAGGDELTELSHELQGSSRVDPLRPFWCGTDRRVHADSIDVHPRAELAWVYDPIESAALEVAERYGAATAPTVDAAIDDPSVDAVVIASATPTHVDLLTRAVRAGKAVLCEKPIDLDLARVDRCWTEIAALNPDRARWLQPPFRSFVSRGARSDRRWRDRPP